MSIFVWLKIAWRSSESLHFEKAYSPWFGGDQQTSKILQISLDYVRKKHTNFVGEAQVNVQKGDLTK